MKRTRRQNMAKRSRQDVAPSAPSRRPIVVWTAAGVLVVGVIAATVARAYQSRPESNRVTTTKPNAPPTATNAALADNSQIGDAVPAQLVAERRPTNAPNALENPLDPARAYGYLQQICEIGPRISGSPGMLEQMRLLRKHFAALGGHVSFQQFLARNPLGGHVRMTNTIVQWHPERKERILLCAHYDTRPLPDRDPNPVLRREGTFIGANDGASGVALLMELAHHMPTLDDLPFGIDFAFFDGEELVYVDGRDPYFLGSRWFSQQYVKAPPDYKYRWGVLLDMVGDADLQIYQEKFSASWRDTLPLVAQIWGTAQRLGVHEFVAQAKHQVQDDHLPLRNIAKIPTCDIIDFDYPAWHTTGDGPDQCSGESLAKVGWVVYEWLKTGAPRTESRASRTR